MATKLEKFAWPGRYTLLYVFTQNTSRIVLCWECATNAQKNEAYNGYNQQGSFIHWEGESLWCDDCGVELPSEYGNPDEQEPQKQEILEILAALYNSTVSLGNTLKSEFETTKNPNPELKNEDYVEGMRVLEKHKTLVNEALAKKIVKKI